VTPPARSAETSAVGTSAGRIPLGALPALLVVAVVMIGGLAGVIRTSLQPHRIVGGPVGTAAWSETLTGPGFLEAAGFTIWLAAATTLLAVPIAVLGAATVRPTRLGAAVASTPVPVPHLAVAGLAVGWLAPGGIADRVLGGLPVDLIADGRGLGIVTVYLLKEVPFLALVVLAAWDRATDERADAATVLGASRWRVLVDVVWPRIGPAVGLAAAIVTAFVIGATEVPLVVGPSSRNTLATWAIEVVRLEGPAARSHAAVALLSAAALATALVGLVTGLLAIRARRFRR
jgi:putative spermidine/putrescine transport system permease protein